MTIEFELVRSIPIKVITGEPDLHVMSRVRSAINTLRKEGWEITPDPKNDEFLKVGFIQYTITREL